MDFDDFYGSCGATCLNSFGGGENGDEEEWCELGRAQYKYLHDRLSLMKRQGAKKLVFAVTTSNQPAAEEMLEHFGFTPTNEAPTSGDRTIKGWTLVLNDFDPKKVTI